MIEKIKSAVWAEGQKNQMNRAFAFVLDLGKKQMGEICLSAASCYKVIADGKLMGFGPNRTAHGYARAAVYPFNAQYITVEVQSHFVPNFCWVKREPFFACVLKTESGKEYFAEDFNCFALSDRVQKVRRYSFQRGFCETYINEKDRTALYFCKPQNAFPRVKTEKAELPHLLPSETLNPALSEIFAEKVIDSGYCKTSPEIAVYVDRTETLIGTVIEGFQRGEWQDFSTDEISRITYLSGAKSGDYAYETLDFSRIVTGIVEVEIIAGNAGEVFFAFDEILSDEKLKTIRPFRGDTANVFKWTVKKAGVYNLSAFEPYAFRYANVITSAGVKANVKVRAYENPEAGKMLFECDDKKIEQIMEAARHTFAHNAVDLLTDCPSRERAGWLSDSFFSSVAERVFTGDNKVERAFLQNYILADKSGHPKGMIPRCYPADYYEEDGFIPNWSLWYILEIYKYFTQYGYDETVEKSRANVEGILNYFVDFENEFGVLEDLKGWIFVEWSAANNSDHINGINVPSNACYYASLLAAAKVYGIKGLKEKAEKVKDYLLKNAYVDGFFVDNLIRNEKGDIIPTENYTETCQYYMFFFKCADKHTHKELFDKMLNEYGKSDSSVSGGNPVKKQLTPSNMIYGVYMRLELLMREQKRVELLNECVRYFYDMTQQTGTLWENNTASASCDHGFASYVSRFIIYALFGFDVLYPEKGGAKNGIKLNSEAVLPFKQKTVNLSVLNNIVTVK
jgi:bacterial alpha-L-rhamnosidase family protein